MYFKKIFLDRENFENGLLNEKNKDVTTDVINILKNLHYNVDQLFSTLKIKIDHSYIYYNYNGQFINLTYLDLYFLVSSQKIVNC